MCALPKSNLIRVCQLTILCLSTCWFSAVGQEPDQILQTWDRQYYSAPTQTIDARNRLLEQVGTYLRANTSNPAA